MSALAQEQPEANVRQGCGCVYGAQSGMKFKLCTVHRAEVERKAKPRKRRGQLC